MLAGLSLLLWLAAEGGLAQAPAQSTADEPPAEATAAPGSPADAAAETDEPELAADSTPDPEPATDPEPETPENPDSPFDYQASEQISEDLSVSFPVDI